MISSTNDLLLGCPTRKVSYDTRRVANIAIKTARWGAGGNSAYRCSHCGLWHIGRKWKAEKKAHKRKMRQLVERYPLDTT